MHVPPSPGHPGEPEAFTAPIGQPEILTGPADEPRSRRKSRKSGRSGLAIAAFSFLGAVILGGGIVYFVLSGAEDTPAGPGAVSVSQPPQSPPEAQSNPEPGDSSEGDEGAADTPPDQDGTSRADAGADAGTGAGADTGTGTGTDADIGANAGETGKSGSGTKSTADKPATDKPVKEPQSNPQLVTDGQTDPRSDGSTGYVAPQGPVAGY